MRHFSTMARFNKWVNEKIYHAVGELPKDIYLKDCGLFFKSVHATLNHLLVVDRVWIGRVLGRESGIRALDQILYEDFDALLLARRQEDDRLIELADRLTDDQLAKTTLYWTVKRDRKMEAKVWDMLAGLFNHQTHHRGQISAILTQQGKDMPDIDLIYYLAEIGEAKLLD